MQLNIPPDLQPLVDKRLSSGEYGFIGKATQEF
jgi:hypothetical protein